MNEVNDSNRRLIAFLANMGMFNKFMTHFGGICAIIVNAGLLLQDLRRYETQEV